MAKMFYTTSYRGYYIHCTSEGNKERCRIQDPKGATKPRASSSVAAAKKRIRKFTRRSR